jgi:hypothetical protein
MTEKDSREGRDSEEEPLDPDANEGEGHHLLARRAWEMTCLDKHSAQMAESHPKEQPDSDSESESPGKVSNTSDPISGRRD